MVKEAIVDIGMYAPLRRAIRSSLSPMAQVLIDEADTKERINAIVKARALRELEEDSTSPTPPVTSALAKRDNEGKPQLSYMLDFPVAVEGLSKVMEFGAQKYERNNWKKGQTSAKVTDSLLRHLSAWQNGQELDLESGENHLYHVVANALMLAELKEIK